MSADDRPHVVSPGPTGPRLVGRRLGIYLGLLLGAAVGFLLLRDGMVVGGPRLHVVVEALAAALALFLGVLALVRFYSRKNNVFLFLGTGFLTTAFLDAVHAAEAAAAVSPRGAWSWLASRTILSLFFCLNWLGWRRERRLGEAGRVSEGAVYLATGSITVAVVLLLEAVGVPEAVRPEAAVPRPQELLPAALFLGALLGYLSKAHWKDNALDHWLVVSLVLGFVGQALFMPFSTAPFDGYAAVGHGAKLAGYATVSVGLMISVYSTFRQAEDSAAALAREVVDRERAQRELEVQKAYLERLFESAPEAIVVLDEDGRIVRMNDEFTRMFGYSRDDALGRVIDDLVVPFDRRAEAAAWRDRATRGQTVGFETVRSRRDGSPIDVSVLGTAITVDPGRVTVYEIYRDITDRRRAEEELRRAKEEAEDATRAKSEFLATMSHELRTPLNSVIGFANVLLKGPDATGERAATFLRRIRDNGLHLLGLIGDVLDLSKIEAGKMTVEVDSVDVGRLVLETLDEFRGQVLDRDLDLEAEVPPGLEPIRTDRGKLKQVLLNLVGNAVKFTDRGRVVVRVVAGPRGRPARIEVEDTGIGIPPERRRKIFEAFEQAETGTARSFGGTGLGLAISTSFCRLLGFELSVESEPGSGSVFRVHLGSSRVPGPDLASEAGGPPVAGSPVRAS